MATEEEDMARLAEEAARELLHAMPVLATDEPIARSAKALDAEQGSAARLKAALQEDTSFGNLRGGWVRQRGGFTMPLSGYELPHLLINGVIGGHQSAESLIDEARSFAKSQTSTTDSYTPLAGVTVSEVVSLGDDIELLPWNDIPESPQKTGFSERPDLSKRLFPKTPVFATSAIRIRSAECQALFPSKEDAEIPHKVAAKERSDRQIRALDAVHCITAVSTSVVAALGHWAQFGNKIANDISVVPFEIDGAPSEIAIRVASYRPVALDGQPIAQLFQNFEGFEPTEKEVIRVGLDRLGLALRGGRIVDKAIDLGIALEVLLLHGIGGGRGELKFRSSIRGATFLGGARPERQKTLELLKAAYDLRSDAIHSGVVKKGKLGLSPVQILEQAVNTCAAIARKLINLGSFPEWDSEYVIGGEQ